MKFEFNPMNHKENFTKMHSELESLAKDPARYIKEIKDKIIAIEKELESANSNAIEEDIKRTKIKSLEAELTRIREEGDLKDEKLIKGTEESSEFSIGISNGVLEMDNNSLLEAFKDRERIGDIAGIYNLSDDLNRDLINLPLDTLDRVPIKYSTRILDKDFGSSDEILDALSIKEDSQLWTFSQIAKFLKNQERLELYDYVSDKVDNLTKTFKLFRHLSSTPMNTDESFNLFPVKNSRGKIKMVSILWISATSVWQINLEDMSVGSSAGDQIFIPEN
jgi:hypothetical protein